MPNHHGLVRSETKAIAAQILRPYLTAKKDRTMLTQYARIHGGRESRIRTVLSPVVTETGRLASGESFVDEYSTNLQNLSKKEGFKDELYKVRDCFIPDEGMVFVATDLDKAEAVIMAIESENWEFYELLVAGEDVHKWVAAQAYHNGDQGQVTKEERQRCKNVLYASFYLAGIPKITSTINSDAATPEDRLTQDDVSQVYDVIMDVLHLDRWWDAVWKDLHDPETHGGPKWLGNALGVKRRFFNPDNHKLHKEAVNFFPQSTVASLIDIIMIDWWENYDCPGEAELILQVHDELLYQVRADKLDYYVPLMVSLMERTFHAKGREVHLTSGATVGQRWGMMSDYQVI